MLARAEPDLDVPIRLAGAHDDPEGAGDSSRGCGARPILAKTTLIFVKRAPRHLDGHPADDRACGLSGATAGGPFLEKMTKWGDLVQASILAIIQGWCRGE